MRKFTLILLFLLAVMAQAEPTMTLADVASFDSSHIGYAGSASPNFDAFKAELARGEKAAPLFEKLLKQGKPAAKIYSALGLYSLDKERGMAALESLRSDDTPLRTMSGCMMDETTVGKVATELLQNNGEAIGVYVR